MKTFKTFLEAVSQIVFFVTDNEENEVYVVYGFSSSDDVRQVIRDNYVAGTDEDEVQLDSDSRYDVFTPDVLASKDFRQKMEDSSIKVFDEDELISHIQSESKE